MKNSEKGSVIPIIALLMIGAIGALYVLSIVTRELGLESKAQTAADAAALAGATKGQLAATIAARVNDASIVSFRTVASRDVIVTVTVRGHRATARAQGRALAENKSGY